MLLSLANQKIIPQCTKQTFAENVKVENMEVHWVCQEIFDGRATIIGLWRYTLLFYEIYTRLNEPHGISQNPNDNLVSTKISNHPLV